MSEQPEQTGRADCTVCQGAGSVDLGERRACPFCLWIDGLLYGTAFVYKDRRIDPTTVKAANDG